MDGPEMAPLIPADELRKLAVETADLMHRIETLVMGGLEAGDADLDDLAEAFASFTDAKHMLTRVHREVETALEERMPKDRMKLGDVIVTGSPRANRTGWQHTDLARDAVRKIAHAEGHTEVDAGGEILPTRAFAEGFHAARSFYGDKAPKLRALQAFGLQADEYCKVNWETRLKVERISDF